MNLAILYRGPLASCNYDCPYCPFAKRRDPPELLRADRAALDRFAGWVAATSDVRLSVLFTPWGEGLTRRWYRDAMVSLSHLPHVDRVVIQTNLAARVDWLADADPRAAALWATYHPGQVDRDRFLGRCARLTELGVRYSVGVVGLPEHLAEARALRAALPAEVYLWVNAAEGRRYDAAEEATWTELDPLFGYSVRPHVSLDRPCHAGETAISVRGDGTVRRCHFIDEPIGNLYDGSWRSALRPRPCGNAVCDCHIGYVHLKPLGLRDVFAGGVLERIPAAWPPVRRPVPLAAPVHATVAAPAPPPPA
ncbi:STM4011 family radical SAM protein [Micromonospora sp. DT46]|uniref:STM4011 family radical SAM protein n=1 Tax=unclassified Micromonospora TaxID=2617518 RepID=UPI00124B5C46|nr:MULTISPECIES: STM4011 family radical SAM protein [unclassified Micromonospora]KAB1159095.1 radical SAM protein [Micromonospora sp. AMSO12t]WSG01128.1 STM4011 family radical SAM protein [Micromonospora sp. NBC_01740]